MTTTLRCARGATLIELLITLAMMGVIAGVTTLAVRRIESPSRENPFHIVEDSLRRAMTDARTSTVRVVVSGHLISATANPDGSVTADSAISIERLTGRGHRVR